MQQTVRRSKCTAANPSRWISTSDVIIPDHLSWRTSKHPYLAQISWHITIWQSTWTPGPCQTIQLLLASQEIEHITELLGSAWQLGIVENTWTSWTCIRIYDNQLKILLWSNTRNNITSERLDNQHTHALDDCRNTNYSSLRRHLTKCYAMVPFDRQTVHTLSHYHLTCTIS